MKFIKVTLLIATIAVVSYSLYTIFVWQPQVISGRTTIPEISLVAKPRQMIVTREQRVFINHDLEKYTADITVSGNKLPYKTSTTNEDDGVTTTVEMSYYKSNGSVMIKQRVTYDGGYGRTLTIQKADVTYKLTERVL